MAISVVPSGIRINGTAQDDKLIGRSDDEQLYGLGGNDTLYGSGGRDYMYGGDGNDVLDSNFRWDRATETWLLDDKGDYFDGGPGDDTLYGGAADDTLAGGDGNDSLHGMSGADHLIGGDGDDTLDSGISYDPNTHMFGTDSAGDLLEGGAGNDTLYGRERNDTLDGGSGNNQLYGGAGNDTYLIRSRTDSLYDSEGTDSGIIYADWFKPSATVENWSWAPGVEKLPYWLDALIYGNAQVTALGVAANKTIHYSFVTAPASYFTEKDKDGFVAFTADEIAYTRKALAYIETVIDVHFVETNNPETPYTLAIANNTQKNSGGYAAMLNAQNGSVVMVQVDEERHLSPSGDNGSELFRVLVHELGHSLGLKHSFGHPDASGDIGEGPFLPEAEDNEAITVMSYTNSDKVYGTYSPFDIAALQYLYGAAPSVNAGDSRYVIDPASSQMISDGAGIDTLDGSAQTQAMTLFLDPGYWGYVGKKADLITAAGQVTVNFGTVIENASGGSGADHITGNGVANTIDGGAGDDVLEGAGGNDKLVGGAGLDSAVFTGKRAGFTATHGADGWVIADGSNALGRDTLVGIERVAFDDGALALDLDGTAGLAYRLYAAAFDRTPDLAGLGYWMAQMDQGMSLLDVATGFTRADEFTKMYGATRTAPSFLDTLYHNILHRAPDAGGIDYWTETMQTGMTEGQVLALFSESPENQTQVIGQIEKGIAYLPFS